MTVGQLRRQLVFTANHISTMSDRRSQSAAEALHQQLSSKKADLAALAETWEREWVEENLAAPQQQQSQQQQQHSQQLPQSGQSALPAGAAAAGSCASSGSAAGGAGGEHGSGGQAGGACGSGSGGAVRRSSSAPNATLSERLVAARCGIKPKILVSGTEFQFDST